MWWSLTIIHSMLHNFFLIYNAAKAKYFMHSTFLFNLMFAYTHCIIILVTYNVKCKHWHLVCLAYWTFCRKGIISVFGQTEDPNCLTNFCNFHKKESLQGSALYRQHNSCFQYCISLNTFWWVWTFFSLVFGNQRHRPHTKKPLHVTFFPLMQTPWI